MIVKPRSRFDIYQSNEKICLILKFNVSSEGKGRIWKTKEFVAGTSTAAFALAFLLLTLIQPMMVENTHAISENAVQIGKIDVSLQNIDNSIASVDGKIEKMDGKIDKLTVMMCDVSAGKHC